MVGLYKPQEKNSVQKGGGVQVFPGCPANRSRGYGIISEYTRLKSPPKWGPFRRKKVIADRGGGGGRGGTS